MPLEPGSVVRCFTFPGSSKPTQTRFIRSSGSEIDYWLGQTCEAEYSLIVISQAIIKFRMSAFI